MGVVYKAFDRVTKRQVAVKTLLDLKDPTALKLFEKECEDLASLAHPNIVEIFDIGRFQEAGIARPYLVMPLLQGITLDKLIRSSSSVLTVERSIDIICQACRGLQAAHDRSLIHRDIKPSNIFVMEDDSVKIIDFGVAHRIETTLTIGRKGTLLYMSPEQVEMKPLSAASDIFSLGVVGYEALTGNSPFERDREDAVVAAILRFAPPPATELNPSVSPAISQAIFKAIAKQPCYRYSSAREFGETLLKAFRNESIEMFDPARIRPRLQRAIEAFNRGDCQFAADILGGLEAEGCLDAAVIDLRRQVDTAIRNQTVTQLLDTARARLDAGELPLALQKVKVVLQIDPQHVEAMALQSRIESRRNEDEIAGWLESARRHLNALAFPAAREALQRILRASPRDSQALQLLTEVDRIEGEQARLRQQEEQLFQFAVEADEHGDVANALYRLERVLELERLHPDLSADGRGKVYRDLYDAVRAKHEGLQTAYLEAKRLLREAQFAQAMSLCDAQLSRFPGTAVFQALKIDIEERRRRALSGCITETDRQLEAEPDLDLRAAIVEEALREYPGEPHFEQLLQRTREKRDLVEGIVSRARSHEQQGQFAEALSQWETLRAIHSCYSGLVKEIERLTQCRDESLRSEARRRWTDQIDRSLELHDYARAIELVRYAQNEFPGDVDLARLESSAREGIERSAEAQRLLSRARQELSEHRYDEATDTLEKARARDDDPRIGSALLDALVERAGWLAGSDQDSACVFLQRALELEPGYQPANALLQILRARLAPGEPRLAPERAEPETPAISSSVEQPSQYPWVPVTAMVRTRWLPLTAALLLGIAAVIFVIARKPAAVVRFPSTASVGLEITTQPEGATVWVNGKESGVASNVLRLQLPSGTVDLEARLPGYQSATARVNLVPKRSAVSLTLAPVLLLRIQCSDGVVTVNGNQPEAIKDGLFLRQLPVGDYTVSIQTSTNGRVSFSFEVVPDGPAVITQEPAVKDASALLISNFGNRTRIHSANPPLLAKLDGESNGALARGGLELPVLEAGNHVLELSEGKSFRKKVMAIGPERTLTAIVDSDPDTGTLLVQTNEDGVAISVLANGKHLSPRGESKGGAFRANLRAGNYSIRGSKPGFDPDPAQQDVEIRKGEDKIVLFEFRPKPMAVPVPIRSLPGAEIFVDSVPTGIVPTDGVFPGVKVWPGEHTFRAQKRQYTPNEKTVQVSDRQPTDAIDLPLSLAPVTVKFKRNPPDSSVTYMKTGDIRGYAVTGTSQTLPEGDYTFLARAKGYKERKSTLHISADNDTVDLTQELDDTITVVSPSPAKMPDWGVGIWKYENGWFSRKIGGQLLFPKPLGSGTIQFSIRQAGAARSTKGRIQWVLNYVDDKRDYVVCDLDEESFQVEVITPGQKSSAALSRVPLLKTESYTIQILAGQDGIIHQLRDAEGWKNLVSIPAAPVSNGKFGFRISSGQTLFLANFIFQPR
jgi:hypothetical protein